jgi:hypothetical protein
LVTVTDQDPYQDVLEDELERGAAPVVAKARALVASLKASVEAPLSGADPGLDPRDAIGPMIPRGGVQSPSEGNGSVYEVAYQETLDEQLSAGATRTIAEARAVVAALKAKRKAEPRPPTPVAPRQPQPSAPQPERPATPEPSGAPQAEEPQPPPGPVAGEDPEAAFERVLAEQKAAGASESVATARAKVARVKAQRALKGS